MFDTAITATQLDGSFSSLDSKLIDLLPAAVYVCEAPSGAIIRYNECAAILWGRRPSLGEGGETLCGSHRVYGLDGDLIPRSDIPMANVLRTGEAVRDKEVILERPDGSRIFVRVNIEAIRNEHGEITGAVNVFQDIGPASKRETRLRHLRQLIKSLPTPAYMCDAAGRVTYFNSFATELWGYTPDLKETNYRYCCSYKITETDGSPIEIDNCWMARALRDNRAYHGPEVIIERPDGSRMAVIAHVTPFHSDDGQVIGAMNVLVDISDRKALEFNMQRLLDKLSLERERLIEVFERSPAFMAILGGPDFVIERANDRCHELLGRRELIGHTVRDAIPEVVEQGYMEVLEEVYRTGKPVVSSDTPVNIRDARGSKRDMILDLVYEPLITNDGSVTGVLIHGIDLTERKRAETQLARLTQESERLRRLYETVVSNTPDLVYVFDLNGRFTFANQALLDMWGQTWEDAIGKNCLELGYEPGHAQMHEREIAQVISTGQPVRGEVPFTGTNGTRIYDYIFVPVFSETGEVEAVAGTTRDITERKQLEQELQRRAEELAIIDRKKDEFIAVLAHELRNPLAPVRNGLRVMQMSKDKKVISRIHAMMDRQLNHMVRLVDDLLDVSRLNSNKMYLQKNPISLAEIMNSAVETVRPAAASAKLQLTVSVPETPIILDADFTRLAQVFSNLLSNSVKYTPPGGRIWFFADATDSEIVVTVRDNGVGIPKEELKNIFDLFSQVSRDDDCNTGGLGIGLALVKTLVEMHNGSVAVNSEGPGRGCTFTVRLPTVACEPAPVPEHRNSNQISDVALRRRILVVDDNRDACDSMAMLFEMLGNDVREAYDGQDAVDAALEFKPDIVLMDVGMPRLDGYEATRRMRQQAHGKDMIIVAVTGWGQEEDRSRSRAAGCDGHLVKPVTLQSLENLLAEIEKNRTES